MNTTMLQRLGQVLYWTGCAVAALAIALALFGIFVGSGNDRYPLIVVSIVFGALSWAFGRACRYVLSGN